VLVEYFFHVSDERRFSIFIKKVKYFQVPFIVGQISFHFQWCLISTASA